MYAYIGQSIELRCVVNETSGFTRIQHRLPNGSVETLLSNNKMNTDLSSKSELHIQKISNVYIVKIEPVRLHSAGTYICQDDMSSNNKASQTSNITVHVIGRRLYFFLLFFFFLHSIKC